MSMAAGYRARGNAAARKSAQPGASQTALCTGCASGGQAGDRHAEKVRSEFF